jgi:hypothetical protein
VPKAAKKRAASGEYSCPLSDTHDKFEEAHYFLHRTISTFHVPDEFRWNLSAFLQALYSVTWVAQKELAKRRGYKAWWEPHQKRMHGDAVLSRLLEGRNIVVHRRRLLTRSTAQLGWYRGTVPTRAISFPIDPDMSSEEVMRNFADVGDLLGGGDSDEQLGVLREWVLDDLADENEDVVLVGHRAWTRVGEMVTSAHTWLGATLPPYKEDDTSHLPDRYDLLLEVDVPGLVTRPEPPPRSVAFLSRRVWHADVRPRRVYREEPVTEEDSGWRVLEGEESDEWFDHPQVEMVPVTTMAEVFPDLAELLRLDQVGHWEWDESEQRYVPVAD